MSNEAVSIKGSQDGLIIHLNETASLSEILSSLEQKLIQAKGYFDDSTLSLSFSGRKLSTVEKHSLLELIRKHSRMNILSIDEEEKKEKKKLDDKVSKLNNLLEEARKQSAHFYNGTLRSGQSVKADNVLVVLGDVNNGAIIDAGGSVIILGKLRGVVNAGLCGNRNSFIFALEMKPTLLQINQVYGRFEDDDSAGNEPMIAYVHQNQIAMETITHSISKELEL